MKILNQAMLPLLVEYSLNTWLDIVICPLNFCMPLGWCYQMENTLL